MLLVSHNMTAISSICQKAMLIEKGQIHSIGASGKIVSNYNRTVLGKVGDTRDKGVFELVNNDRSNKDYGNEIKITRLILCNENGEPANEFHMGGKIKLRLFISKEIGVIPVYTIL